MASFVSPSIPSNFLPGAVRLIPDNSSQLASFNLADQSHEPSLNDISSTNLNHRWTETQLTAPQDQLTVPMESSDLSGGRSWCGCGRGRSR